MTIDKEPSGPPVNPFPPPPPPVVCVPLKLGRKAIRTDSRTLRMGDYLTPELPLPPDTCDWTKGITDWGMMLNDQLGCCTIAALGHAVQTWTANTTGLVTPSDAVIEATYEDFDGYVPGDPSTDNGGIELDVLSDFKKQGFSGETLLGYADPNMKNIKEIRQTVNLFGGVYIGVSLPLSAQTQDVWDVAVDDGTGNTEPGSWGGHAVWIPKYDENSFECVTWGRLKRMTLAFWLKYVDEAHALFSNAWLTANGAPNGFAQDALEADLGAIV